MPITSHQTGSMIGGQQALFGNFASYAQQISPMGQMGGPPPTYQNPMGGVTGFEAPPLYGDPASTTPGYNRVGTSVMSGLGVGIPAAASAAMMAGVFMPGPVGNAARAIDPFSRGMSAFGRGVGWQSGATWGSNFGRLGQAGFGGVARAGLAGLGSAALTALPMMAAGSALQYGLGQMVEGAQFQNQVGGFLQNNFRFINPQSESGYGFGRNQQMEMGNMIREMGSKELLSTPQEMLRLMQQGTGMGMFRAVQDAREFKTKFQEMVGAVKEIAKVMNTSLEGAMPFLQNARQMGFWTPQDIMRQAQSTRATAISSGMTISQVQAMQMQGAQMARSVGAQGTAGALGMKKTIDVVSGALRSGVLSEQQLSDMTGGLQGPEATQAMAQTMMQSTARFAASSRGRWVIAALANRNMEHLDPARMDAFLSGRMGIGQIGGLARRNVSGNAFNFVMNEERLRGELMEKGPQAQAGFVRSIAGDRLFDNSDRSQYIMRRLIKRYFGGDSKYADSVASMARELPRIMMENIQKTEAHADQQARTNERAINESWEGAKRQLGKWWEHAVDEPLQKMGSEFARNVSEAYGRGMDKLFGRVAARNRVGGISEAAGLALQKYALGNTEAMNVEFGTLGFRGGENKVEYEYTGLQRMWRGLTGQSMVAKTLTGDEAARVSATMGKETMETAMSLGYKSLDDFRANKDRVKEDMHTLMLNDVVARLRRDLGSGEEYAQGIVSGIRSGQIKVGETLRKKMGVGSVKNAATRLAALQSGELRESHYGIDMGGSVQGLAAVSGGGLTAREAERKLQRTEEEMAQSLSEKDSSGRSWGRIAFQAGGVALGGAMALAAGFTTFGAGLVGGGALMGMGAYAGNEAADFFLGASKELNVKTDDIGRLRGLKTKDGLSFEDAAKYEAYASHLEKEGIKNGDKGKLAAAQRYRARADDILGMIRADASLPEKERTLIEKIKDSPKKRELLTSLGIGLVVKNQSDYATTVELRRKRMVQQLGAEGVIKLEELGGADMVSLLKETKQDTDPRTRAQTLERLSRQFSGSDEARAKGQQVLSLLSNVSGSQELTQAISGGMTVDPLVESITGRKRGALGSLNTLLGDLGTGVNLKQQQYKKMMGPDSEGDISTFLAGIKDPEAREKAGQAIRAARDKDAATLKTLGHEGSSRRAQQTLAAEAALERKTEADLGFKSGEFKIHGGKGTPEGMHTELAAHTALLKRIDEGIRQQGTTFPFTNTPQSKSEGGK